MSHTRTQIYLEPDQHAGLLKEARRLGLSLAGLIRRLVDEHLKGEVRPLAPEDRKKAALSLIGLGKSNSSDVSEKTDAYLGQALYEEMVGERRSAYNKPRKAKK